MKRRLRPQGLLGAALSILWASLASAQAPTPAPLVVSTETPPTLGAPTASGAPTTPSDPPWTFRHGELLIHPQLQVRMRAEERVNPYGSAAPLDDELHFVTTRFRVGLTADYRRIRIVLQAQDARSFGAAPLGTDAGGSFGIHQAYGEYRRDASFLRLGRQEVAYGDERLVGPLDWTSAARSFDAIRGHFERGIVGIDATAAIVAPQAALTYAGPPITTARSNGDFFGAAQLSLAPLEAMRVELLYLYRRDRRDATSPVRDRRISAASLRVTGSLAGRFRYAAEGIFEWGEVSSARFVAYAAVADVFYTSAATNPSTVTLGGALGSGERSGRVGEFENFFPTNHKFYGFADLFGLRNLVEMHATLNQRFTGNPLALFASAHTFFLERSDARWTNAGGGLVAAAAPGTSRFVGAELDVGGNYRFGDLVQLTAGYSLFVPASAAERLGRQDPSHWVFCMVDFRTP